jgi:hypothetical protein
MPKFLDKNFINNLILLLILLFLANYLSKGSIINVLQRYYNKIVGYCYENFNNNDKFDYGKEFNISLFPGISTCDNTTPPIVHDQDFKYIYNNDLSMKDLQKKDEIIMRKLYHFLQSLISVNNNFYELNPSNLEENNLRQVDIDMIRKYISSKLNCGDFTFKNIEILDDMLFYDNITVKEIKPFRISTNIFLGEDSISNITLQIEMNIRNDKYKNDGYPSITRIKLIEKNPVKNIVSDFEKFSEVDDIIAEQIISEVKQIYEEDSLTIPDLMTEFN